MFFLWRLKSLAKAESIHFLVKMFLSSMTEGEHYMKIITNISRHSKHDRKKKNFLRQIAKVFSLMNSLVINRS